MTVQPLPRQWCKEKLTVDRVRVYLLGVNYSLQSDRQFLVTFEEKSTLTMTTLLVVVFGGYFVLVLGPAAASPDRQDAAVGLVIGATIVLALLATASHIVLALLQTESFWIAQALLGAWVLAEVSKGVAKLVLYRRGA